MFYPVKWLKKGGKYYLCWVADSWPLRFATITHRQLWSQDIRKICDDLVEVITIESGYPSDRFSLRLSSQLMRGLVRLYQRKVTHFLSELCMINAVVNKHVNKRLEYREIEVVESRPRARLVVLPEAPEENEERVEEILQRSNNMVARVEEITLREPMLVEQPFLDNNFGELNPEHVLLDVPLETMLAEQSAAQHSAELPLEVSADRSADKSRLAPHDVAQMERLSEHDLTMYRKSIGDELMPIGDIEKDVPEIPDINILPPEPEVPQEMQVIEEQSKEQEPTNDVQVEQPEQNEIENIVLEELEEGQVPVKRRRWRNKIIDKNTKLSSDFIRARIQNNDVELRCENSREAVMSIRVPANILLGRPAHAGARVRSPLAPTITTLFTRNLGVINRRPSAEREFEEGRVPRLRPPLLRSQIVLESIEEQVDEPPPLEISDVLQPIDQNRMSLSVPRVVEPMDTSDLPTQVIEQLPKRAREDTGEYESISPKRPRRCGNVSMRRQLLDNLSAYESNKENIPDNYQQEIQQPSAGGSGLTRMLQAHGLADAGSPGRPREGSLGRYPASDSSETPLGSLDRTKVSLGDSDVTTESRKFIRTEWGAEGTMTKIVESIRRGVQPLDLNTLLARGPQIPGTRRASAARCFVSVLNLKQHGFLNVSKDPESNEITNIKLGAKCLGFTR